MAGLDRRGLEWTVFLVREQLILGKEDVHVVELTVKSRETLLFMFEFRSALDKMPLQALLGHLVLFFIGTDH